MAYAILENGRWFTGNVQHTSEWQEIIKDDNGKVISPVGLAQQEQADGLTALKVEYKALYLKHFDDKLNELDYDSIATVQTWIGDSNFGLEAQNLLDWYKAIVDTNYRIMNEVLSGSRDIPTPEEYIALLPIYQG